VNYTENGWGGLRRNSAGTCLLDGSVNVIGMWYYAIGSFADWHSGIPAWNPAKTRVELYVRTDKEIKAHKDRDESTNPEGKWILLFRQTYPNFFRTGQWSLNADNPNSDNYSILDKLESYRSSDGDLYFKLFWPRYPGPSYNIWKQTSNPVTTTNGTVSGYAAIQVNHTDQGWGGLRYNRHGQCLLDGSVAYDGYWYYAIGSFADWNAGIPSWNPGKLQVELYVKQMQTDKWILVFRQTHPFFFRSGQWRLNSNKPSSRNYSILDRLEEYRNNYGSFYFKILWPDDEDNIWLESN
jgi:hypothetical protein